MATKTIVGISALIKTKLESLVDGDSNRIIPEVLEYPTGKKTEYPSVEILPIGSIITKRIELTAATGARLERAITFRIKVYQDSTEQGAGNETAITRTKNAIDAILSSFDTDPNLSEEVALAVAEEAEIDFSARFPNALATIDVRCVIIVP